MGRKVLEQGQTRVSALDPAYTNLTSVFHFMIGNTDFSPIKGPRDDLCCHNHLLLGDDDGLYWSVPFDFDQSGLVDTPYAAANPRFKLHSVRQRLYRGRCANNDQLPQTIAHYQTRRAAIYDLIENNGIANKRSRTSMKKFLDRFYATLDSERRIERDLIKECI